MINALKEKPKQNKTFLLQIDTVDHSLLNSPPLASMATYSSSFSLPQSPWKGQTCMLLSSPWWLLLSLLSFRFLQSTLLQQRFCCRLPNLCPSGPLDYLCDSSTWMSQRCPKSSVQRESLCAPNVLLLSSHTTIHRVPKTEALQSCSSPHLPIPVLQRNWGLSILTLSLDSVFFYPFQLSPSRPGHCHLVPGLLQ